MLDSGMQAQLARACFAYTKHSLQNACQHNRVRAASGYCAAPRISCSERLKLSETALFASFGTSQNVFFRRSGGKKPPRGSPSVARAATGRPKGGPEEAKRENTAIFRNPKNRLWAGKLRILLAQIYAHVWELLGRGPRRRKHGFRTRRVSKIKVATGCQNDAKRASFGHPPRAEFLFLQARRGGQKTCRIRRGP